MSEHSSRIGGFAADRNSPDSRFPELGSGYGWLHLACLPVAEPSGNRDIAVVADAKVTNRWCDITLVENHRVAVDSGHALMAFVRSGRVAIRIYLILDEVSAPLCGFTMACLVPSVGLNGAEKWNPCSG